MNKIIKIIVAFILFLIVAAVAFSLVKSNTNNQSLVKDSSKNINPQPTQIISPIKEEDLIINPADTQEIQDADQNINTISSLEPFTEME